MGIRYLISVLATVGSIGQSLAGQFPADFKSPRDAGGFGQGEIMDGFGGNKNLSQAENRLQLKHRPVLLVHGNGGSALHPQWGMEKLKENLISQGYTESEIWAPSYLGVSNSRAEITGVHRKNVEDIRAFLDAMMDYLGVEKVDIIAHSLGATLSRAMLLGYFSDGLFHPPGVRISKIGAFVSLAGAHRGLGCFSPDEFKCDSDFLKSLSQFSEPSGRIFDPTPLGNSIPSTQLGDYRQSTALDRDEIRYVSLWANGDFVDSQNAKTGRLEGADLNQGLDLGPYLQGHERIIKDPLVTKLFLKYLN